VYPKNLNETLSLFGGEGDGGHRRSGSEQEKTWRFADAGAHGRHRGESPRSEREDPPTCMVLVIPRSMPTSSMPSRRIVSIGEWRSGEEGSRNHSCDLQEPEDGAAGFTLPWTSRTLEMKGTF